MPLHDLPNTLSLKQERPALARKRAQSARTRRPPGTGATLPRAMSMQQAVKALARVAGVGDAATAQAILERNPAAAAACEPMRAAIIGGHVAVVRVLLDNGADPNALIPMSHPCRPLHQAIEQQRTTPRTPEQVQVVQALLDGGADVMERGTSWNVNTIALAAMGPEKEILSLLLPHYDTWEIFTATVLGEDRHVATMLQRDPALAHAADVNGMNALHYCAASRLGLGDATLSHRLARCALLLLDAGADPQATAPHPEYGVATATTLAHGNRAVLEMLVERGGKPLDALQPALWESDYDTAAWLVKQGVDLKQESVSEAASDFSHWGHFLHTRWLIERGAEVDGRDKSGRTPLHWACQRGASVDFVRFLLEAGANAKATDWQGETPMRLAMEKKKTAAVKLLREFGAV